MNEVGLVTIIVAPMVTGAISSFASLTILLMVHRSTVGLSTTFRRLFFALCIFDLLQALSQCLSTIPMPAGSTLWAIGTSFSCDIQGFFTSIGSLGAIWYTLSISIYFFLVIKYNISDQDLRKIHEPFLHAVPIICSLGTGFFILATNNYNVAGETCWIAPEPLDCLENPEVTCISKFNPRTVQTIYCIQFLLVFVMNCFILVALWYIVYSQHKKQQDMRFSWIQKKPMKKRRFSIEIIQKTEEPRNLLSNVDSEDGESYDNQDDFDSVNGHEDVTDFAQDVPDTRKNKEEKVNKCCSLISSIRNICQGVPSCKFKFLSNGNDDEISQNPLSKYMSRPCKSFLDKQREIANRAMAFIIGYLLTYIFAVTYRAQEFVNPETPPPFFLKFLARLLFPMQGIFNILCFAYPHVAAKCRDNANLKWRQAFWEVIRSGGDKDKIYTKRTSMQSMAFPINAEADYRIPFEERNQMKKRQSMSLVADQEFSVDQKFSISEEEDDQDEASYFTRGSLYLEPPR